MTIELVVLLALGAHGADGADVSANQIWVISTRGAGSSRIADENVDRLDYRRFDARSRRWQTAGAEEFFATDQAALPMTVFVHGDRTSYQEAISLGWTTYRWVECQAAGRPFRFVVWSWPADQVLRRGRLDSRLKACRSDAQAYHLAGLVDRIDPVVPVNLIGHSYGARIITGAMHILGGGQVGGRGLMARETPEKRARVRAVLVAAAMDADWLLPGRRHGRAIGQLDRLLLIYNPRDPGLKWYPLLYGLGGPSALGYVGLPCSGQLGPEREKVETVCLAGSVGRYHEWIRYMRAPELTSRVAQYAFLESEEE